MSKVEHPLLITWLNDFIFCPISIYFHNLYSDSNRLTFQEVRQINGSAVHERIDTGGHSTSSDVLSGLSVYTERFGLSGKIDIFKVSTGELTERKKKINVVYDGYVFQLYAQYFAMTEMGYLVKKLSLYSLDDNKRYPVPLPSESVDMLKKFECLIKEIQEFDPEGYKQNNIEKCRNCIYEPLCDASLLV